MLNQLILHLIQKNCPNYWIPSINLFEKLSVADYEQLLKTATKIKKKPQKYVADNWLEYTRWLRRNCCYWGKGYKPFLPQEDDPDKNCCHCDFYFCCCCPFKSDCKCCFGCCSSKEFKKDPLAVDVY